jgi:thiol-disulfide isomerase/thioredoxin
MSSNYKSIRMSSASQRFNNPVESSSNEGGSSNLPLILLSVFIIAIIAGSIVYGSSYYYRQTENFADASSLNKNYVLQYYNMPNCGHCKDFDSDWDEIVKRTTRNQAVVNYTTVKYDITDNGDGAAMGRKYNVNSTPSILLVNISTGKVLTFNGNRTPEAIIAFATDGSK